MTLEDVQAAKAALEAEGLAPSYNAILERLGYGSKRDVARLMQALTATDDVAVLEAHPPLPPSDPPLPPAPEAAPLHQARHQRDQTAAQEHALGQEEQRMKQQRKTLEEQLLQGQISAGGVRSDAADLAGRRRSAFEGKVTAQDAYEALHGQACRWLRRLRQAQRQGQAGASACARGEAREEFAQALAALARLVGRAEAQALADDPTLQPAWLRE